MKKYFYLQLLAGISFPALAQIGPQPNIVWIMAEDMGTDLECYGMQGVKTPNLNRLAEEGMRFDAAYCTGSISSPSRSAMITGVHQNVIGAHNHRSNRNVVLPQKYKPITYYLKEKGYTTILGNSLVTSKGRKTDCNFKSSALGKWDGTQHFDLFDKFDKITATDQPFFAQLQLLKTHRGDWWKKRLNSPRRQSIRILLSFLLICQTILKYVSNGLLILTR